eukprot:EG_transcript_3333
MPQKRKKSKEGNPLSQQSSLERETSPIDASQLLEEILDSFEAEGNGAVDSEVPASLETAPKARRKKKSVELLREGNDLAKADVELNDIDSPQPLSPSDRHPTSNPGGLEGPPDPSPSGPNHSDHVNLVHNEPGLLPNGEQPAAESVPVDTCIPNLDIAPNHPHSDSPVDQVLDDAFTPTIPIDDPLAPIPSDIAPALPADSMSQDSPKGSTMPSPEAHSVPTPVMVPPQRVSPSSERIQLAVRRESASTGRASQMEPLVLTPSVVPVPQRSPKRSPKVAPPVQLVPISGPSPALPPMSPEIIPAPFIQYSADDAIAALEAAMRANEEEAQRALQKEQATAAAFGARAAVMAVANELLAHEAAEDASQVVLEEKRPWAPDEFIVEPECLAITLHDKERIVVYPGGVEQLIQRYPGIDVRSIVRRERIGEGTFAGIYRATLDGHTYAVKSLHSIEASEMHLRNAQRSIKNEIYYALHCTQHANIVPSYQVWWEDGGLHILMDYVDLSLAFLLERLGPLQERILSHISLQMLHGMHGLRQTGLVHQDINAENILVGYNGMVRLCDFGMVSVFPDWGKPGGPNKLPLPTPGSSDYKKWDTCSMGLMLVQCAAGIQRHLVMSLLDQEGGVDFDPIVERHFKAKGLKPPSDAMKSFVAQCVALASCEELLQHPFITDHSTSVESTSLALESWLLKSKSQLTPPGAVDSPSASMIPPPVPMHATDPYGPSHVPYSPSGHPYSPPHGGYAPPPYSLAGAPPGGSPAVPPALPPAMYPPHPGGRLVPVGGVASARAGNSGYAAPRVVPVFPPTGSAPPYAAYDGYPRAAPAILPTP